jgi:hypothetical protein
MSQAPSFSVPASVLFKGLAGGSQTVLIPWVASFDQVPANTLLCVLSNTLGSYAAGMYAYMTDAMGAGPQWHYALPLDALSAAMGNGSNIQVVLNVSTTQTFASPSTVYRNAQVMSNGQVQTAAGVNWVVITPTSTGIPGEGTVISVSMAASSNRVSVTGGPVTFTGTFNIDVVEANLNIGNMGGTLASTKVTGLSTVATSGAYADLTGRPTLATVAGTGAYSDLTGKPTFSTVATSGSYLDLNNKPSLSTVATSGSYTDLTNKPSIPTQYTDAMARAAISVTGGASYNASTGVITVPATYADANARAAISVTGGASYNASTGVITVPATYADANARAAISVTGTGVSYNNSTGVITVAQVKGTIGTSGTLSGSQNGGRYKITASISLTVPAVGAAGGDSNPFPAGFDCEFFLASGVTLTLVVGSGAVIFNNANTNVARIQSGTTNTLVALVSDPVTNNNYAVTGS